MAIYDRKLNTRTTDEVFERLLAPAIGRPVTTTITLEVPMITPVLDYQYIENILEGLRNLNQTKYTKGYTFFYQPELDKFNIDSNYFRLNSLVVELACIVHQRFEKRSDDSIVEVHWRYKTIDDGIERHTPTRKIIY